MFFNQPAKLAALLFFLLVLLMPAAGQKSSNESAKILPDKLGDYRAIGRIALPEGQTPNVYGITDWAARDYVSKGGQHFAVVVSTMPSDSAAYAAMTGDQQIGPSGLNLRADVGVGTASLSYSDLRKMNHVSFFKGRVYVSLRDNGESEGIRSLEEFGRAVAANIDKGEGEIPALVKHLPGWENGGLRPFYAVTLSVLKSQIQNQPIFDTISFDGGAEAASAGYGPSKLLIIEFNTPQLATDNNAKVVAKMQELRSQGQPTPTAYRRVGNYAVFVFNGADETSASQLIDQVKYQQVVQWLGENPFAYEAATREFTETTLGVLVAVVKTSGLALVACLGLGGLLGAILFRVRRSQQRAREAFADSDAMLRLNLDELTPERQDSRLIGPGR